MFLVPTATVTPEATCAGTTTDVTVAKALVPFIVPVVAMVVLNVSEIDFPSMFLPFTTIEQACTELAVPPTVTDKARGTSGSVNPELIVVPAVGMV
jgi:hypothetical protein